MKSYKLLIITPEKEIFKDEVTSLLTGNIVGEFQILANHEPFITTTIPTITKIISKNGDTLSLFTSTGVIKVYDNEVIFCTDAAEWPQDIDSNRALEARKRAESRLSNNSDNIDVERAKLALSRALVRLSLQK